LVGELIDRNMYLSGYNVPPYLVPWGRLSNHFGWRINHFGWRSNHFGWRSNHFGWGKFFSGRPRKPYLSTLCGLYAGGGFCVNRLSIDNQLIIKGRNARPLPAAGLL